MGYVRTAKDLVTDNGIQESIGTQTVRLQNTISGETLMTGEFSRTILSPSLWTTMVSHKHKFLSSNLTFIQQIITKM